MLVRDGVRLASRDWGGPGQPIVVLHGLAGHAGEWDVPARSLSSRYRVVAVDQRGHGADERDPRDVSRAAYVAAVVEHLALQRVDGLKDGAVTGFSSAVPACCTLKSSM